MKYILLPVMVILFTAGAIAQSSFIMSYPIAFPMGDLNDYINKTSFRGFNLEYLRRAKSGVGVGIEAGWNVFYESVNTKDYKDGTNTISGKQYRYTNAVPILAQAKFLTPSKNKAVSPYVGLGIGTLYVNRTTEFGLYDITTETWQFLIRPEAGLAFNIQPEVKAFVGAKYYAAFNTSDLDGQPFLSVNVGVILTAL